jgi:outer membrane protein assembly factor BamB
LRPTRRVYPWFLSALLVAGLGAAMPAMAQDAEAWSQFQGGPDRMGVGVGPAPGYRTAWESPHPAGGPRNAYGLSAPIVIDGAAVAVGPEEIVAVDLATGDTAWTVERALGPPVAPAAMSADGRDLLLFTDGWGHGPRDAEGAAPGAPASPAPEGPIPEGSSRLVAVSIPDGEEVWAVDLPDVSRTGVTRVGSLAVVGTIDGTVIAVDVTNGEVAWTGDVGGYLDVSLAADDASVLVPVRRGAETALQLVSLAADDGTERWRYTPPTPSAFISAPSLSTDTAYVALADYTVRAVSLADGVERWTGHMNWGVIGSPPVLADGAVYVADLRGQVYRFDAETGERAWDHPLNTDVVRTTPVAVGEWLVVGTAAGEIVAFEAETGDAVWRAPIGSGPVRGLAPGGDVLVAVRGGADAGLIALENDPAAELVRVRSGTVPDPVALVSSWASAAVPLAAVLFFLGRFLWGGLGPVVLDDGDEPAEDDG